MASEQQGKSIDDIMANPLSEIRADAAYTFAKGRFSDKTFDRLAEDLRPTAADAGAFDAELAKVRTALKTGKAPATPNLQTPQNQLLWGAALAALDNTPDLMKNWPEELQAKKVSALPLWNQIAHCPDARTELRENAFILATSLKNPKTKIAWGAPDRYPDVAFYFNSRENRINLDMVWSLMIGIEHSRAANLHEIGHSQGTLFEPKGTEAAYQALLKADERRRDPNLTEAERLIAEREMEFRYTDYRMRYLTFDEAENNYANRYAVNQSQRSAQDFGTAVNTVETTLCLPLHRAFDENKPEPDKPAPMDLYKNLKALLRYSFYVNNGMAEDTDEGWRRVGVRKEWLSGKDKDGNPMTPDECFADIRALCTTLENTQPTARDRLFGASVYAKKAEECSRRRAEIVDDLYDRYVADLIPEIVREKEKEKELQQQQQGGQQNQNNGDQQDRQNQQQQSGQNGNDGENNENKDGNRKTETDRQLEQMEQQMSQAVKDMKDKRENGGDEKESDGKSAKGKNGEENNDEGKDDKTAGAGNDKEDDNNKDSGKDASDDKESGKDDDGETVEDLINNKNNAQNTEQTESSDKSDKADSQQNESDSNNNSDAASKDSSGKGKQNENWNPSDKASKSDKKADARDLRAFLPENLQSINEYNQIVKDHQQTAKRLKSQLVRMQNSYLGAEKESNKRQLVPEDGDISKFDVDSYVERQKKLATGQEVDERDFEHFRVKGEREKTPAPIDIAILIDRSGSMGRGPGSKLETALTTACVLFESARKNPFFNVYIAAAGDPQSLTIAEPGMKDTEIARRITTLRDNCGGCKDMMADAIETTMTKIKNNKKQEYAGATHFFVVSDGNFNDEKESVPMIKTICEKAKAGNVTFNTILTEKNRNMIENLADEMSAGAGSKRIDRVHISGPKDIERALTAMLNRRMAEMCKVEAQTNDRKAKDFGRILDTLKAQKASR